MSAIGRFVLLLGIVLILLGGAILLLDRFHILHLGRLPGDIRIHRGNFTLYFPLVTCLLLSILLTFLFSLFRK
ncbi:MAG: DUF2905 domain-containing protein [Terriglobia bacterium]